MKTPRTNSRPQPSRAKPRQQDRNGARGLAPLPAATLGYDKPLCASLAGFTLHAATRAGALDTAGRERLLRYVLRPRMKLVALVTQPKSIVRYLAKLGEPIDVPTRHEPRPTLLEEHRPAPKGRGMTAI